MLRKVIATTALFIICTSCYKTDPVVLELLKQIQSQNEVLKNQIVAMQKTTDSLAKNLSSFTLNFNNQTKQLDSIKTQLSIVLNQINLLNSQLVNTNSNIAEIQAKLIALQATCDQLLKLLNACCNSTLKKGQLYEGGIIAFIDSSGLHGLIVSQSDLPGGPFPWRKSGDTSKIAIGAFSLDGLSNSNLIINVYGTVTPPVQIYAALAAKNYTTNGFNDWYLPSYDEWLKINETRNSGVDLNIGNDVYYITSSEDPWNYVGIQVLLFGTALNNGKGGIIGTGKDILFPIRAVRKF